MSVITEFKPDAQRRKPLWECMKNYGVGDRSFDWPNNMVSTKTVVYANGTIVRRGEAVEFRVPREELDSCIELSEAAFKDNRSINFDFGSETSSPVWPFFIASNAETKAPKRITEGLIRRRFGGTLFPLATITVERLRPKGIWWDELVADRTTAGEPTEPLLASYYSLCQWFEQRTEIVASSFIRIGDRNV